MRARDLWAFVLGVCVTFGCGSDGETIDRGVANDAGRGGSATSGSGGSPSGGTTGGGGAGTAGAGGSAGAAGAPDAGDAGEGMGGEGGAGDGGVVCTMTDPVVITSEAELVAFAARGCEVLDGSLTIQSDTLTNLDALGEPSVLRVITGDLILQFNPLLESLAGFYGLREVGGSLSLDSGQYVDLRGFELLARVGTDPTTNTFIIASNARLETVAAFGLETLRANVNIAGNDALTSLEGIDGLVSTTSVTITNNPVLTEFGAFAELEHADSFIVASNASLLSMTLPALETVGSFTVTGNAALAELGLPALETAENLTIAGNEALTTVGTLEALTSVGMLVIAGNPMLPQCFVDELDVRLQACNMSCGGNDTTATCN